MWTTKKLRELKSKQNREKLAMLTCYDFQTAVALNNSEIDLVLVGDSLGNVILGYDTTCRVTVDDMITFGSAVKRGATNKFTIIDMPFGSYACNSTALSNGIKIFQKTGAEALKLEGANKNVLNAIKSLIDTGIPVAGHIGLTPQFFHQQGGYFTHGKTDKEKDVLIEQAQQIQEAGASLIVLECITPSVSKVISQNLKIPTIGIGSGEDTDGQVLVINDLLGAGPQEPPSFCKPIKNLFQVKSEAINSFAQMIKRGKLANEKQQVEYGNIYN
mgnify:CR=1 FL=1